MSQDNAHRMRGDRFRLFLNVFHTAQYMRDFTADRDGSGDLSAKRTRAVLQERCGFSDEMLNRFPCCDDRDEEHYVGYAISYFITFMGHNAEQLREVSLDVTFVEELLSNHVAGNELGDIVIPLIRNLMRAIATGELTEADFGGGD